MAVDAHLSQTSQDLRACRPVELRSLPSAKKLSIQPPYGVLILLTRAHRPYGLCVTDHALGRAFERSDLPALDAVLLAHDALMTLTADDVALVLARRSWAVPAGDAGAWLCDCTPIYETVRDRIELGCCLLGRTFVVRDQMTPEQAAQSRLFGRRPADYFHAVLGMNVMRPPILSSEALP